MRRALAWLRGALGHSIPAGAVFAVLAILLAVQLLPLLTGRLLPAGPVATGGGIELKDFIVKVKADLEAAEQDGIAKHERPLLELQDVQLVANFVVRSSAEASVKLVTVDGSAMSGLERSQQITLHLRPVPPEQVVLAPSPGPLDGTTTVIGPTPPPAKAKHP